MFFKRLAPAHELKDIIDCYWIIEDDDATPRQQKIIPDGFDEIIYHYGSPYRINLGDRWEVQSPNLLAGQIRKHFFLENTGPSGIIGVKMRPTALTHLFGLSMHQFTDRVVDISSIIGLQPLLLLEHLRDAHDHDESVTILDDRLKKVLSATNYKTTAADLAVDLIFAKHGMIPVSAITKSIGIGERQLENLFKKYIGLSPKFFMRIIRFNYIFKLVQDNNQSWSSLATKPLTSINRISSAISGILPEKIPRIIRLMKRTSLISFFKKNSSHIITFRFCTIPITKSPLFLLYKDLDYAKDIIAANHSMRN